MEFISIQTSKEKKKYIEFIYRVYNNNPCYKDTLISIVNTFLYKKDSFTKECYIKPVVILEDRQIVCQCMFVHHEKLPVLQVAFFEALAQKEAAVEILIQEAKAEAKRLNLKKIIIGLNGHVSYGVGLLADSFDKPCSFDCLYTQPYYREYFMEYSSQKQTLTTYAFDMANVNFNKRLLERVQKEISVRKLDMKRFRDEMLLFGDLCNRTLKNTYLYFDRPPVCIYEMINEMKVFLVPENLLFAVSGGKEVGFLFWHPDYNEIIPGGRKNSMLSIGIRYLSSKNKIKNIKLNSIGVLPEFQRKGAVALLLNEAYIYAKNRYTGGETNFVWDNNTNSRLLNQHLNDREFRHYCVFEINL